MIHRLIWHHVNERLFVHHDFAFNFQIQGSQMSYPSECPMRQSSEDAKTNDVWISECPASANIPRNDDIDPTNMVIINIYYQSNSLTCQ